MPPALRLRRPCRHAATQLYMQHFIADLNLSRTATSLAWLIASFASAAMLPAAG